MRKFGSVLMMGAMVGIVIAIMILAGFGPAGSGRQADDKLEHAKHQLEALILLGTENAVGRIAAVVKWQGDWKSQLRPEEAAGQLAEKLGLNAPELSKVQDHTVYEAEGSYGKVAGKLSVMELDNRLYVVFRLDGTAEEAGELQQAQWNAGRVLLENGADVKWNASVQGLAPASERSGDRNADAIASASEKLKQIEMTAAKLKPAALDAYSDGTTVSRSYYIPSFSITSIVGEGKVSGLQMAVHTDTVTGLQEVSFGSPMLTIEY
ncbi:hypothetical protein [Paenibacillus caui]|uniref:hypothetical protein n=1 Tax=Paenibacillus caui TaxID=2873927 RepID=UPI001CA82D49|nr:hypothetical protein [Paenibacillus caui]